jgi:hypothetical protein
MSEPFENNHSAPDPVPTQPLAIARTLAKRQHQACVRRWS